MSSKTYSRLRTGLIMAAATACMVFLAACLPYPLGDPEKSQVDPAITGFWVADQGAQGHFVTVFPHDDRTYVLHYRSFRHNGDRVERDGVSIAKAWLTHIHGSTFITIEPLEQRLPSFEGKKYYCVMDLDIGEKTISARLLNNEFEGFKNVASAQDVADVVAREIDNPKMYQDNRLVFERLDATRDKARIEQLVKTVDGG